MMEDYECTNCGMLLDHASDTDPEAIKPHWVDGNPFCGSHCSRSYHGMADSDVNPFDVEDRGRIR